MCGFCGKLNKNYICDECNKLLEKVDHIDQYDEENIFYNKHMYLFKYEGTIRQKIIDYKFNEKSYLYKMFEKIILNDKKVCDFIKCYDIIIPVPIHYKRKMERGYNQTELIVTEICKDINKEADKCLKENKKILMKNKNTVRQSSLNKEQRSENIKDAYSLNVRENIKNKKILIFDDIYTTGNTVNECAKVIKKLEPKEISVLTIAKD